MLALIADAQDQDHAVRRAAAKALDTIKPDIDLAVPRTVILSLIADIQDHDHGCTLGSCGSLRCH